MICYPFLLFILPLNQFLICYSFCSNFESGLAFWYGSRLVIDGELKGSDVMVVFFSMLIGAMALIAIPTSLQSVGQGQSAAFKVYSVINRVPPIDAESEEGIKASRLEGNIEFRNIDFHYPTRPDVPILKGLTLKVSPGQTVAFVGYVSLLIII